MKNVILAILICFVSGCSMFENGLSETDRGSARNISACDDTYSDVDDNCANSITPQTY